VRSVRGIYARRTLQIEESWRERFGSNVISAGLL